MEARGGEQLGRDVRQRDDGHSSRPPVALVDVQIVRVGPLLVVVRARAGVVIRGVLLRLCFLLVLLDSAREPRELRVAPVRPVRVVV